LLLLYEVRKNRTKRAFLHVFAQICMWGTSRTPDDPKKG